MTPQEEKWLAEYHRKEAGNIENLKTTDMTPQEEKWLAEYQRKEAGDEIKIQYRALVFWAIFAIACLILLFFREERKFTFLDSLFVIMIVLNIGDLIRKIIGNKRILAGTQRLAKSEDAKHTKDAEEA